MLGVSEAVRSETAGDGGFATPVVPFGRPEAKPHLQLVRKVEVDRSRDALLTDFGKKTLEPAR
jgi:ribonucleoside-diphosphate reductase alpha chain